MVGQLLKPGEKIVHAVLLTKTEGTSFSNVHPAAKEAGAETWRHSHVDCAGTPGARLETVVRDVVCPRDRWPETS